MFNPNGKEMATCINLRQTTKLNMQISPYSALQLSGLFMDYMNLFSLFTVMVISEAIHVTKLRFFIHFQIRYLVYFINASIPDANSSFMEGSEIRFVIFF